MNYFDVTDDELDAIKELISASKLGKRQIADAIKYLRKVVTFNYVETQPPMQAYVDAIYHLRDTMFGDVCYIEHSHEIRGSESLQSLHGGNDNLSCTVNPSPRKNVMATKKGWCLLSYSAPTVINDGNYDIPNDIRYDTPHDMPMQYLYDECQSCLRNDPFLYSSVGQILCDGWEPISVGEIVGGRYGYGRFHSFKKQIEYNPGEYIAKENR